MFLFLRVFKRGETREGRKAEISYERRAFREHVQLHPLTAGGPAAFPRLLRAARSSRVLLT